MADVDDSSKTEQATPERRRKAREEGQFARARDAGGIAATLAVVTLVAGVGGTFAAHARDFASRCFRNPYELSHGNVEAVWARTIEALSILTLPIAGAATLAALGIGFAEAGFQPRLDLVLPKWSRLDPLSRLKTILDPKHAVTENALSIARIAVVGYVTYQALRDAFPMLLRLSGTSVLSAAGAIGETASAVTIRASVALAVLAGLDYFQNRWRLEKQLMMSRQELKDEMKQQEGDMRVKMRQRALARQRLKKGIAKAVRGADVVVANPTHVSVALRYKPEDGAPVVVAKGYDDVALHIRSLARDAGVPIVENRPLARAMASRVRVGSPIPVDLFAAVAEVLAFVYRLKGRNVFG